MLKKLEKIVKNVIKQEKTSKKIENRQKCRKPRKIVKNVENPVKNRQKYRKMGKNVEKLRKNHQKCREPAKTVNMSKNR